MRALSLWQPWASAMAVGIKEVETRSWAPPATLPRPFLLAIHASKRTDVDTFAMPAVRVVTKEPLPLGAILGVVRVLRALTMTPEIIAAQTDRERLLGDWRPGRVAWFTEPVAWLHEPIPCRGFQGLWNIPGDVMAKLRAMGVDASVPEWNPRPKTRALFEDGEP